MTRTVDFFDVRGIPVANIYNDSKMAFFGVVVLAGSNYETPNIAGISHYGEHIFFKGTKKRDWKRITQDFAKLGASNNAYTSNTEVVYHATVPDINRSATIELLLDMVFNSVFPSEEIERERGVILEEIKMYEDDPTYYFLGRLGSTLLCWEKGHDTVGVPETVKAINRDDIIGYLETKTSPENMMFVFCGNCTSDQLREDIEAGIPSEHPYLVSKPRNTVSDEFFRPEILTSSEKFVMSITKGDIQQSNISMDTQALSIFDPRAQAANVLRRAVGGGMYSKLFARIREELGLCYSVGLSMYPIAYPDYMMYHLYGFLAPENVDLFMEEAEKVLSDVVQNGIDEDLFTCAKTDYMSDIIRRTETSCGRGMYFLSRYLEGRRDDVDDIVRAASDVSMKEVNELAGELLGEPKHNWSVMNPA